MQAFSKKNKIYAVIESRDMLQKSQHELIKKNLGLKNIPAVGAAINLGVYE